MSSAPASAREPVPAVAPNPVGPAATGPADPEAPDWRREPPDPDQVRSDAVLAGALFVGAVLSMALLRTAGIYEDPAAGWVSVVGLAAACAPLAARRRWPSAVAVLVAAVFIVVGVIQVPETTFLNIALFIAMYTVGAWEADRRRAAWVRGAIIVAMFGWLILGVFQTVTDPDAMPDLSRVGLFSPLVAYLLLQLLTNILYFAGAYYFGNHAWAAARDRARIAFRGRQLQLERQVVERQAITLERLRLARELHDAVAHHVSMMGVQAAVARSLMAADSARAGQALEEVEESARQSIAELQGVLGMLRDGPVETGEGRGLIPIGEHGSIGSLTVARIPELVEQSTEVGLPAAFQVVGEPAPLPPLVSLNLYRIAQEALTNARKHGGVGARADVRLRYLPRAVELEIADDGAGVRRGSQSSSGLGLVGMRERAAADGGTLEAGPRARGGFLVRVSIPLAERPPREASDDR